MSPTPSVTMVRRGIGFGSLSLMFLSLSSRANGFGVCAPSARNDDTMLDWLKQTELLPAALWLHEVIRGQLRTAPAQTEFLAGDLDPAPDHPGHRPSALHP